MYKPYLILWIIIMMQAIYTLSAAQSFCGDASIDSAGYKYGIGKLDECIDGLNKCLKNKQDFNLGQKTQAYHLLAKCYLALDSMEKADSIIAELLSITENFETDPDDPESLKNEIRLIMANIVSSVSKLNEDIRLAPATAMVILQEEILQRGYTDLIEILKDIPGFDITIYYGQLYANVYQRGFRSNNTQQILLLFDGVEDNDLWTNFADISQQYPVTNIKRVEVIYGPASTMYGPNAFSGVINVITKDPSDYLNNTKSFGIHANTGIGSYNSKYIDASAAYKKGDFSFVFTGRFYKSDRPNLSSQTLWDYDPNAFNDYAYSAALKVRGGGREYLENNRLRPDGEFYYLDPGDTIHLKRAGIEEAKRLNKELYLSDVNGANFTKFSNPSQSSYINVRVNIGELSLGLVTWSKDEGIGTTYTDAFASVNGSLWRPAHYYTYLKYNKRINDKLIFTALLNYKIHAVRNGSKITNVEKSYAGYGGLELKDLVKGVPASWLTTYYYQQSEQYRSEFKLLYHPGKNFYLISGIELRNSQLQGYYLTDTSSSTPQNTGSYPDSPGGNLHNVNDLGIYTQGSYRTKKGFGFTAGARLDYNEIRQGGGLGYHISPRFVIDYVKKGYVIKTIISSGLQNVSNFTKFDDVLIMPNPSLTSESIFNYEISVSNKISRAFLADIDFYYLKVKDAVAAFVTNRVLRNENIGEYKIKGIMANLSYKSANSKWQASINYSFTDPKQTKDFDTTNHTTITVENKVSDISAHKINMATNVIVLKNFNLNLRINYISSKKLGEGTTLPNKSGNLGPFPGYIICNTAISAKNIVKGATLQLVCNNIFNKVYYGTGIRSAGGIRAPDKILQMGRNFYLKINYEF